MRVRQPSSALPCSKFSLFNPWGTVVKATWLKMGGDDSGNDNYKTSYVFFTNNLTVKCEGLIIIPTHNQGCRED